MALDATARESNVRDSLKKHFVDNIKTTEGIEITFDKGLAVPNIQGTLVDRWVAVQFGAMEMDSLAAHGFNVYCCTRKDPEGFRLTQLRDKVLGYLVDTDQTDSMKRITLYRSRAGTWTQIGAMVVQEITESASFTAEDETKYKILTVRVRWGAKI